MKTVLCDLTDEEIENGVPNYGRGVHSFVVNAAKDIVVNVSFRATGRGVVASGPSGMWSGQSTGGVNLSKAGLVAALNTAKDVSKVQAGAVGPNSSQQPAAAVDDLNGAAIAQGSRNYGRGTSTVLIDADKGITMEATFYKGNAGGVDLSATGWTAAMEAARLKAVDAAGPLAQSENHIATGEPGALTTEAPGVTRPGAAAV